MDVIAGTLSRGVLSVVGARPNFMKVGPVHRALQRHGGFVSRIVHTGQHYDEPMSEVFFRQLELPEPDFHLGVGSDTHARQTARVMIAFEEVVEAERTSSSPCTAPPTSTPGRPSSAGSPPWSAWRRRGPSSSPATFGRASGWSPSASRRTLKDLPAFHLLEPLGYLKFLRLMEEAAVVVTDSGGIQEETTFLGVPCLTLQETTERPVTVELGTNRLVPLEPEAITAAIGSILDGDRPAGKMPPLWDGRAAERIVEVAAGALLAPLAGRHVVS